MENIIIKYKEELLAETADVYFDSMCGFTKEKPKAVAMKIQASELRNKINDKIQVRGIYSIYTNDIFNDGKLLINNIDFSFQRLSIINKNSVIKIIPYILTAGDYELDDSHSMLDKFYADTYGTAYVDAGRDELKRDLLQKVKEETLINGKRDIFISDSIGPGFYGIDTSKVGDFFKILDGDKIEVKTNYYNVILPVKSCVGMFIIVDDSKLLPDYDCMSCTTKDLNCTFCRRKDRETGNA